MRERLRRWDQTGIPLLSARLAVGGTLAFLGAVKVADPVTFLKVVREYGIVPDDASVPLNVFGVVLPWLEVWCGLLLLLGVGVRGSALVSGTLLLVFSGAIARRALHLHAAGGGDFCAIAFDCGCGSGIVPVCPKLAQNAGLVLLCLLALCSRSARWCLRRDLLPPRPGAATPSA